MKRVHSVLLLASLLLCTTCSGLKASLDFGSKDAKISIASGTQLNITSSNMSIDGTLELLSGGVVSGAPVAFDNGVLSSRGLDARLTGSFDPSGTDSLKLYGGGSFYVEPGTTLQGMTVFGENTISGQPSFAAPVVLHNDNAGLTLNIQSVLGQDIMMHGGVLSLADNLALADNVRLVGDGVVLLNNRRLDLGSTYTGLWDGNLAFYQALDLTLNGSLHLSGQWNFAGPLSGGNGNNVINGKGCVLDLSSGGALFVGLSSALQLNNIVVKGIGSGDGDGSGALGFVDTSAIIKTSSTTLQFDNQYTLSGQMVVQGPTVLALADKNFIVGDNGSLIVDGTTLWIDPMGAVTNPGTVIVPAGGSGSITYLNGGTIKFAQNHGLSTFQLVSNTLTNTNIVLDSSVTLDPGQRLVVSGQVSIDGNGSYIEFMDPNHSQLILQPGSTLTLKNIEFRNLKSNTLDLRATATDIAVAQGTNPVDESKNAFSSARIKINQNVEWKLDQDITFTNGTIEVVNTDAETGVLNVFVMSSEKTPKTFYVAPLLDPFGGITLDHVQTFSLNHNTLQLENVTFRGLRSVQAMVDDVASPAIALSGNASIDQDAGLPTGVRAVDIAAITNNIDIFVENENNRLMIRNSVPASEAAQIQASNNATIALPTYTEFILNNNIYFGDSPINHLMVSFSTTQTTQPMVTITSDPGIQLTSANGIAHLEFTDQNVMLNLARSGAFSIDSNGMLSYNNLFIQNFPIQQLANDIVTSSVALGGAGMDASFVRSPKYIKRHKRVNTLQLKRIAEGNVRVPTRKAIKNSKKNEPVLVAGRVTKRSKKSPQAVAASKVHANVLSAKSYLHDLDEKRAKTRQAVIDELAPRAATRSVEGVVANVLQPAFYSPAIAGLSVSTAILNATQIQTAPFTGGMTVINGTVGGYDATANAYRGFLALPGTNVLGQGATLYFYDTQELNGDGNAARLSFQGGTDSTPNLMVVGSPAVTSNNAVLTIDCTADSLSGLGLAQNTNLEIRVVGNGQLKLGGTLVLPDGCNVRITQDRTAKAAEPVVLLDGFNVQFMGADATRARFIVDAAVAFGSGSNGLRVTGLGSYIIGENADFAPTTNMLIFGSDVPEHGDQNGVNIIIDKGARVNLGAGTAINSRYGQFNYFINSIIDLNGGVLAMNSFGTRTLPANGFVNAVVFGKDGGINFTLGEDDAPGRLVIGHNVRRGGGIAPSNLNVPGAATPLPIAWDGRKGQFTTDGTGQVEFVDLEAGYDKSVTGVLANPDALKVNGSLQAGAIALPAIQQNAGFSNTVYVNGDRTAVRSADGLVTAQLPAGVGVSSEYNSGEGLSCSDANGFAFNIDMANQKDLNGVGVTFTEADRV
ncbi:hypothetical protein FJ365_01080 [Candidatus Dependentiae bacterium]|nr:hypothetical protein [Candidatus Dependentiae bacterium]